MRDSTNVSAQSQTTAPPTIPTIPTIIIGKTGSNPLPMIDRLWEFYSSKGIKTVIVSVGSSTSPLAELDIIESLGCNLNIIEYNTEKLLNWKKVKEILTSRKETEETTNDYTKEVVNKWILPKKIILTSSFPSFTNGSIIDISGSTISTIGWKDYVKSISPDNRVDLLNIQVSNEIESSLLYSFISSGYRPGLIIISWSIKPDESNESSTLAGHIQNCGYMLIEKINNKFLYIFNDKNLYEICSFENSKIDNPIIYEILKSSGYYDKNKKLITEQSNIGEISSISD